jgi:hypothetical protein
METVKFIIEVRVITTRPDIINDGITVKSRGEWQIWKRYKTLGGMIQAFNYYKKHPITYFVKNTFNDSVEYDGVFQFRANYIIER